MVGENKKLEESIEQNQFFKIARPEDFDNIPDLAYFKQFAKEAYNDLAEKDPVYLLTEGERIGSFDLKEPFAAQGMQGTLFRAVAWRGSPLFPQGEICLIKGIKAPPAIIPNEEFDKAMKIYAKAYRSFYNERRILYMLRKEYMPGEENHLVQMIECNLDPTGGKPYIAMRFVPRAESVQKITSRQALVILHDLAHALKTLSAKGISHGDVKPENIIISPDGRATLIDLGCAIYLDRDPDHAHLFHTPVYAPPEFAELWLQDTERLKAEEVRPIKRTLKFDAYTLGISLYEILSGENVNKKITAELGTMVETDVIKKVHEYIAHQDSPRNIDALIQDKNLASDEQEIWMWLNTIIKNLTEPNPAKRMDIPTLYFETKNFLSSHELKHILEEKKEENKPELRIVRFERKASTGIHITQPEETEQTVQTAEPQKTEQEKQAPAPEVPKLEVEKFGTKDECKPTKTDEEKDEEIKKKIKPITYY